MIPAKKASPSAILLRELPLPDTTSLPSSDPLSLSVTRKVRVGYIRGKVPTSTVSQLQLKMRSSALDVVKPKVTEAQALRTDPDKFLATKYSIPDRPAMRQRGGVSSKPLRPYKPRAAKFKGQAAQQTASNLASCQDTAVPSSIHQTTARLLKPYGDIDPLGHPVSPLIPVAPTSVSCYEFDDIRQYHYHTNNIDSNYDAFTTDNTPISKHIPNTPLSRAVSIYYQHKI